MLEVQHLTVSYGGVHAVNDVSFTVGSGEILGLIGPNGAGKSTTVNAITGIVKPDRGRVLLAGVNYAGAPPHRAARAGIGRTFQQAQLWTGMTVEQNLLLPLRHMSRDEKRSRVSDIAHAVGISELLGMPASILPYGTRRLAEVGRALVGDPRVLILDEPAAGLSTTEKGKLAALLAEVARSGTAVLLIDHDMQFVMRSCPRLVVMDAGSVIATGAPTEIQRDRVVLESYLGSGAVDGVA